MRHVVTGIQILTADGALEAETTHTAVGPHVLVLTTTLPTAALTVTTTYTGAADVDTHVVDLALGPRLHATTTVRRLPREELPVTHARERCLLDHLAQVRAALTELRDVDARIDVPDHALEQLTAT